MRRRKTGQFAKKGGRRKKRKHSPKKRAVAMSRKRDASGHFLPAPGKTKAKKRKSIHAITPAEARKIRAILKRAGY